MLGTNGAGKTSTLEVLEGLAQPTSGTVRVLGQDPYRDRRTVRPRIGTMLQDRGFAADLTVAETTKMRTGTLSTPRPVGEILELVELTDLQILAGTATPAVAIAWGQAVLAGITCAVLLGLPLPAPHLPGLRTRPNFQCPRLGDH